MELQNITDKKIPRLLQEMEPTTTGVSDDEPLVRPYGISEEEFDDDYKKRIEGYKKRRPELYRKIVNGL